MEITNAPVRLTADPEAPKTAANGKLVATFNAAYNWRSRTADGFRDVDTTFFRCTLWEDDGATSFASLGLKKGVSLRVSGRWSKNRWVGKDGKTRVGDNLTVTALSVVQNTEISLETTEPASEEETLQPSHRKSQAA